ncbi:UNVERIFIED_CONTAM: hypothetical protein HDU68_007145 [Siphonaria sp. JEL0065]|nr:hypothetical protein HDU68_007145 [Siphonaria sp. JEL0065]
MLGVPAISRAVANVAISIQSFVNLLHRTLPKLYPYLETSVLYLVKWSPIGYERIEGLTTVALRSVLITQTKKLALPLIQYMTIFTSYCFILSVKYTSIISHHENRLVQNVLE